MTELTLHTGAMGSATVLHVDWFDHNNIPQKTELQVRIRNVDKPRTLEILLNGVVVGVVPPKS